MKVKHRLKLLGFLLQLLFIFNGLDAQKIFFRRSNYADSIIFQKAIRDLALNALDYYKTSPISEKTNDNLFRLYLCAGRYAEMDKLLRQMNYQQTRDSTSAGQIAFHYQVYSATLQVNVQSEQFETDYTRCFKEKYNALSPELQGIAEFYFNQNVEVLKRNFENLKREFQQTDSMSLENAIVLCRSFLAYTCFSKTQHLAQKIIKQIEDETYFINDTVMVAMPDGGDVQLTVVRSKKDTVPQAVALMYSIYTGSEISLCKSAVAKGYVGIIASTRGKRESKDTLFPCDRDARDAYHIIDWISKQPWCNGKVGMYGGSYLGFSQWSAVKYLHPALKTIVPQVAVAPGIDYPIHNGVAMNFMLRWLNYVGNNKYGDEVSFANTIYWDSIYGTWYQKGLPFRVLDSLQGSENYLFQRWLDHPHYDAYWQSMTPQKEEFAQINIPILTTTGYYDTDQLGALYYYKEHVKWNKNANHYVVIGPYDHSGAQFLPNPVISNYAIDNVAQININDLVFEWFDYTMKEEPKPSILKDKINYEIMGRNEWRSVSTLDAMGNDSLVFFISPTKENGRYRLTEKKNRKNTFIYQEVDFTERSELRFIFDEAGVGSYPHIIDSTLQNEKDKLVFVSEPLENALAICGALQATLEVEITKYDMDVVIDLFEQTPQGEYFVLNQNIQRASYAKNSSVRNLLKPGNKEQISLHNTFYTARQLQKGSRIIVVLGVNKNPNWQVNYGSGKEVSEESMLDVRENLKIKWYSSSTIKIPVLRK